MRYPSTFAYSVRVAFVILALSLAFMSAACASEPATMAIQTVTPKAMVAPADTPIPANTAAPEATYTSMPTDVPLPTATVSTATATPEPDATSFPTATPYQTPTTQHTTTPTPTATPTPKVGLGPGTYAVGRELVPGVYAGMAGEGIFNSCYWARLKDVSGSFDDIIANDNAVGQFYIEVLDSDGYLETGCEITPIAAWPAPSAPLPDMEPGTYLVGRDIAAGTYQGQAGEGVMDSCYWVRLSGLTGEFQHIIANDNATGQFYVKILPSDHALTTACPLNSVSTDPSDSIATAMPNPTATPDPTATPGPTTPTPTPTPKAGLGPGTYAVGQGIEPGLYAGMAGEGVLDSCYWARLKDVSGAFDEIIANDNAVGQFYIEVLDSDGYLKTGCELMPIAEWPAPSAPITNLMPGTYLVGRDISAGTYQGKAGEGVLDSCYWERLSGLTGDFDALIANDNAQGQFYVIVLPSDYALTTNCSLERAN